MSPSGSERALSTLSGEGTIREARTAAGLTMLQASRVTGLPMARLATIEGPDARSLTPVEVERLRRVYSVRGFRLPQVYVRCPQCEHRVPHRYRSPPVMELPGTWTCVRCGTNHSGGVA